MCPAPCIDYVCSTLGENMARYLCLIVFALLTITMDCFFLDSVARFPSENRSWDIQSNPEQGTLAESDETQDVTDEIKHGSRVFIIKILLLSHAICVLLLMFRLYKKIRRYESSRQQMEEEVRMAKAESERAHDVLFKKTREEMKSLCTMSDLVKRLQKINEEKPATKKQY